ncbi:hypothetical protein HK096_011369, partial [Nowakowskiella sp. JEL0078]
MNTSMTSAPIKAIFLQASNTKKGRSLSLNEKSSRLSYQSNSFQNADPFISDDEFVSSSSSDLTMLFDEIPYKTLRRTTSHRRYRTPFAPREVQQNNDKKNEKTDKGLKTILALRDLYGECDIGCLDMVHFAGNISQLNQRGLVLLDEDTDLNNPELVLRKTSKEKLIWPEE